MWKKINMPPFMKIEEYARDKAKDYQGKVSEYIYDAIIDGYFIGHCEGFDEGIRASTNVIENIPYMKPRFCENNNEK